MIAPAEGRFAENILHFGRILRVAGLPVGPGRILDAVDAAAVAGLARRDDLYWALHAVFVNRSDQRILFDQAFHAFWENPALLGRLPALGADQDADSDPAEAPEPDAGARRIAEALLGGAGQDDHGEDTGREYDASLTFSDQAAFRKVDFERMSAGEIAAAKRIIAGMTLPVSEVPTRRFKPDSRGQRIDLKAALRASLRTGGDAIPLRRRRRRRRPPTLVILCDISGSMGRYSRMLLHFMHALTSDRDRVHTFVFGTQLTNISRYLRHRDVDVALDAVVEGVEDWSGGTRIGACLNAFNRDWARRVLGQGALVVLITDGLDRDAGAGLGAVMERLRKSCRRLIWLNPLLRYEGFQPKSLGVQAMLPHVDAFRSVHNLDSLAELAEALTRDGRFAPVEGD